MDEKALMDPGDLILEPYFQEHILNPSEESEMYWQAWRQHSELHDSNFTKARLLLIGLEEQYQVDLPDAELARRLRALSERVAASDSRQPIVYTPFTWWKVAALVLFCTGLGFWWYRSTTLLVPGTRLTQSTQSIKARTDNTIQNSTQKPKTTILEDGSVVILSPNSTLRIGTDFNLRDRRVRVTGEAYFEVFHNPDKPFVVVMGQTMTRVLGTSFTLATQKDKKSIQLSVRTGRVAFYKADENASFLEAEALILLPNQQALYRHNDRSLFLLKEVSAGPESIREYIFDDTPVAEVFMQLEKQYGTQIIFEKDKFLGCPITTTFVSESLLERVDIICQAVGAHYEIENGKILIHGSGCLAP